MLDLVRLDIPKHGTPIIFLKEYLKINKFFDK
jgi:hypothetical protein